ncbi:hypothetical protein VTN02DRAFT_3745 [Thermoascus thermophilus]
MFTMACRAPMVPKGEEAWVLQMVLFIVSSGERLQFPLLLPQPLILAPRTILPGTFWVLISRAAACATVNAPTGFMSTIRRRSPPAGLPTRRWSKKVNSSRHLTVQDFWKMKCLLFIFSSRHHSGTPHRGGDARLLLHSRPWQLLHAVETVPCPLCPYQPCPRG